MFWFFFRAQFLRPQVRRVHGSVYSAVRCSAVVEMCCGCAVRQWCAVCAGWAWPVVGWPWPAVSGGRAGVYCMVCGGVRCTLGGPCASVGAGSGGMRCAVGGVSAMVGLPCDGVACAVRSVVVGVVRCVACARWDHFGKL